jgi:hypothetical protein
VRPTKAGQLPVCTNFLVKANFKGISKQNFINMRAFDPITAALCSTGIEKPLMSYQTALILRSGDASFVAEMFFVCASWRMFDEYTSVLSFTLFYRR